MSNFSISYTTIDDWQRVTPKRSFSDRDPPEETGPNPCLWKHKLSSFTRTTTAKEKGQENHHQQNFRRHFMQRL